ncbi:MAG: GspH/FimT family pseudopilin [Magnetococcales bacterium]|nr:GspH/FimT family pseudopilin [Magnetococcales bacterium]
MSNRFTNGREEAGFSLIEMLISLTILAVLATMAAPSFTVDRQEGGAKMVFADLNVARVTAIKKRHNVRLLVNSDEGCHTDNGTSFTIHEDTNNNDSCDSGEKTVTKDVTNDYGLLTLTATDNPVFDAQGLAITTADLTVSGYSDSSQIVVNWSGRITIP